MDLRMNLTLNWIRNPRDQSLKNPRKLPKLPKYQQRRQVTTMSLRKRRVKMKNPRKRKIRQTSQREIPKKLLRQRQYNQPISTDIEWILS